MISAIFRGLGDSQSPMYFIAIACVANIVLDYVFIGGLGMGPIGAALGTTLAQTISVIISLIAIRRKETGIHLTKKELRVKRDVLGQILKIGIPVAVQDGCIQVAFIVISVIANHRGLNDAAAVGVVEKLIGMIFIVPSSMLATVSALSAQNIGAGRHDRAKASLLCDSDHRQLWNRHDHSDRTFLKADSWYFHNGCGSDPVGEPVYQLVYY